jgi:uncharacterized protein YqjF (DUF2071 family)
MSSLLSMAWRDLLYAHWPVDPAVLASQVPDPFSVDTYDGDAYLGVVAFEMKDIQVGPAPAGTGRSFPELNLRTYVTHDGDPGVYFFSLDATDPLAVSVARATFGLPYYRAEARVRRSGDGVEFTSRRTHEGAPPARFRATYRPVETGEPTAVGSLEHFLTERYRFYLTVAGQPLVGQVKHRPLDVSPATATIESCTLFEAAGFDRPDGDPFLHYAAHEPLPVTADRVHLINESKDAVPTTDLPSPLDA